MSRISEIKLRLKELPDGYISRKRIHDKYYNYLQYFKNGKIVSRYIKDSELEELETQLSERKDLEKELADIFNSGKLISHPSKKALELTGSVMSGDLVVATFEKGNLLFIDEERCPLLIKRTHSLYSFLSSRVIDSSRVNSRLLKKIMEISSSDNAVISLYSYGASITDNYWFKAKHSKLKYVDIIFNNDFYADLSLTGDSSFSPRQRTYNPQLTLIGSYEKCWRKPGEEFYLYKSGTEKEIYSELLASKVAELLKVPTVDYEFDNGFIRCKNFAKNINFEPISSIAGDNDSFENVFDQVIKISEDIAKQYLKLMAFDLIINNVDRHNENLGLIRNRESGEILSLAPNFDNNLSLISRNTLLNDNPSKDGLITLFDKFLKKNNKARILFSSLTFPVVNQSEVDSLIKTLPYHFNDEEVSNYIYNRYLYVLKMICNLEHK